MNHNTNHQNLETMKENIKHFVLEILRKQNDRTLIGFQQYDEFNKLTKGNLVWTLGKGESYDTNIIMLSDVNEECIKAFQEMNRDEIIELTPTTLLVAISENAIYKLEIAKQIRVYKKARWIPFLVKKGKKFIE